MVTGNQIWVLAAAVNTLNLWAIALALLGAFASCLLRLPCQIMSFLHTLDSPHLNAHHCLFLEGSVDTASVSFFR